MNKKLIRITTVPMALRYLLPGQMQYMAQNGIDVLMISADGPELKDVIANENCRHIVVPMTRKITPWQDLKCLISLIKIFKKEKPDIVHTHTPKAGLLGMLAARWCGVKVRIHTVAGMPLMVEKGVKKSILKFTERLTYKAANHVWPNSLSLLKIIRNYKLCNENKLEVIGKGSTNGVNIQRFGRQNISTADMATVKTKINYDERCTYLLFIGRLVKDKGLVELVEVFKEMLAANPLLRLIIVGKYESDLDPLPPATTDAINHTTEIIHINWADNVEHYMAVADLFVFPSHREGFPNVVLQSAAMQLPVVCSIIEGNIDIVTHRQTGLLFKKCDTIELKQQLEFALANKNQMQQMAQQLYNYVTANYATEKMWALLLEKYNSLA
jgi:glycosyltransferase involved in cell wall biosynthesis